MIKDNATDCSYCDFVTFCSHDGAMSLKLKTLSDIVKHKKSLKRKESLCIANDKFTNLYVIQQGIIKTFQVDANGNELIRGFYFQGEVLGYEAINSGTHPYSAVALCETVICEVPYDVFIDKLQSKPEQLKQLLSLFSRQLTANSYLEMNSAEQRLAAFILDVSNRLNRLSGESHKADLVLPMSRQDIGNYLRLASETVSRVFSRLQNNKIIEVDHKKLRVLRPNKLIEIADAVA